jgi:hypothetical protein
MIDTDKYEGHTEGPWVFKHINSNWYDCDKIGEIHMEDIAIKEASANAQLISDVPLLLEEVKRLRKELDMRIALIAEVDTMIGEKWNVTQDKRDDWNELVYKHYVVEMEE